MLDTVACLPQRDDRLRRHEQPRGLVRAPGHRERAQGTTAPSCSRRRVKKTEKALAKAQTKDSMAAFSKLTRMVDGDAAHRRRTAADRADRRPRRRRAEHDELFDGLHELLRTYRATLEHDRRVLLEEFQPRRLRAQGRGGRQRRHARLDRADARPRRQGPAVPADEGGPGVGARGVPRAQRVREPRRAGRRRPAADAGRQRHLPRLAARQVRHRRTGARLLRAPAEGLEGLGGNRADGTRRA